MNKKSLIAAAISMLAASTALADLPPPKGFKVVVPRVRFEEVDKYPEHAFVVRMKSGAGNPFSAPTFTFEVKNTQPFTLTGTGRRIVDMHLLALPRKDFDKAKGQDSSLAWLTDKTPGVLKASMVPPSTTASVKEVEAPVTTYRVALEGGKLTAEMLNVKKGPATSSGRLQSSVVAVACVLALALLGIWFARRPLAV